MIAMLKDKQKAQLNMEWSEDAKYNSFNSMKGLVYYEHYQKILDWLDGNSYLPPPVECNLDPFAACNLSCHFCITQRYLRTNPEEVGNMRSLPPEYMVHLVDFLSSWGVRGLCISGGGEPTLHPGVPEVLRYAQSRNMKTSIFTNGTYMTPALIVALRGCQFVTWSINASDAETYQHITRVSLFDRAVANMKILAGNNKKPHAFICARMLILPENYKQIYDVCKMAKELGLDGFSIRPVDYERSDIIGHRKLDIPVDEVVTQFEYCHKEETEDFRVFTVTHKFDPYFHVKHDFNECWATPLLLPILQDGNAYLCVDKKMEADYRLGSCYPEPSQILSWWGSDAHRQLIKRVDIRKCSRCTFSQYNRQMEEVVRNDSMMVSFP